jgi:hypothetical protein
VVEFQCLLTLGSSWHIYFFTTINQLFQWFFDCFEFIYFQRIASKSGSMMGMPMGMGPPPPGMSEDDLEWTSGCLTMQESRKYFMCRVTLSRLSYSQISFFFLTRSAHHVFVTSFVLSKYNLCVPLKIISLFLSHVIPLAFHWHWYVCKTLWNCKHTLYSCQGYGIGFLYVEMPELTCFVKDIRTWAAEDLLFSTGIVQTMEMFVWLE